jgi:acetyl esterase/lipase
MHEGMRWGRASIAALLMVTLGMSSAAAANMETEAGQGAATAASPAAAGRPAAGVPIPLWPKGAPLAQGSADEDVPTLTPYYPANPAPTGTAVIVCPGGSYMRLAMDHEGKQVAEWMNMIGITAFVLKYRLGPKYHHPVMLIDAQRAIRFVRSLAPTLKIDTGRVGIMGFSAGGHLASTAGTFLDDPTPASIARDEIDRGNSRPDFLILGYPVISLTESYAHQRSRANLLGPAPEAGLENRLSNDKQVTKNTPPTFLFHTDDDAGVPPENSVTFYLALKRAGVPAELHVYQHGRHGVGLAPDDPVLSTWPARLADWLRVRGLVPAPWPAPAAPAPQ